MPAADIRFYRATNPYFEFSNFSNHSITHGGRVYPTGEHFFQAQKFTGDSPAPEHLESVRGLPAPGDALRFARNTRDVWRTDWFEVNIRIMEAGLYRKFTQNDVLKALLLSSGTRKLVEDSPRDDFWGIGKRGDGRNELGKVLMRIRERIVREEAEEVLAAALATRAEAHEGLDVDAFPALLSR